MFGITVGQVLVFVLMAFFIGIAQVHIDLILRQQDLLLT